MHVVDNTGCIGGTTSNITLNLASVMKETWQDTLSSPLLLGVDMSSMFYFLLLTTWVWLIQEPVEARPFIYRISKSSTPLPLHSVSITDGSRSWGRSEYHPLPSSLVSMISLFVLNTAEIRPQPNRKPGKYQFEQWWKAAGVRCHSTFFLLQSIMYFSFLYNSTLIFLYWF